ncbi:hypothetical protein GCM10011386_30970 [Parapedobacter defluvii]|uniref:Methyltransferase domain-containing protein n=1 Tax=Parapedobacter defluvii TaxID=2045106 RepID=A0ABQ1M8Q9_9SPHI|nr:class I SAM-dependent methyltransferase [Parapedobacter defluvii]GGC36649.1 hypothetical protein GCM10011386_30970 [Parapedobacter defluvii]
MDKWSSLIQDAFSDFSVPQRWADLGCGEGTFTYALGSLLPDGSMLYAIDAEPQKLNKREGGTDITFRQMDFEREPLPLQDLDGIMLANALHYVHDKKTLIGRLSHSCKPQHAFLIVEYDTLTANPWVPYPIDFPTLVTLFQRVGYRKVVRLGERKSRYGGKMYAAWIEND